MISGILPALATPLDSSGAIRTEVAAQLVKHLYREGVDGLYVGGQTGEGWQINPYERKLLTEIAVRNSPAGKHVIVHVGAMRIAEAIDLAQHAAATGATAVSSLPPPGAANAAELVDWYRRLAAGSPLPLYVYYFPSLSPAVKSSADLEALCRIENVAGLKYTADNLDWMAETVRLGANVLFGRDEVLATGLLAGAHGGIGTYYNVVPRWFLDLYAAAKAGEWEQAARTGERIRRLIQICLRYPAVSGCKVILRWQGFDCGPVLSPRLNLSEEQEAALRAGLIAAGFGELLQPR